MLFVNICQLKDVKGGNRYIKTCIDIHVCIFSELLTVRLFTKFCSVLKNTKDNLYTHAKKNDEINNNCSNRFAIAGKHLCCEFYFM